MKSPRNKTINLSVEEGRAYLDRCVTINKPSRLDDILDKTILGDTLEVMKYLPREFADLIIADPPYNLDKDFNGNKFKSVNSGEYARYTGEWLDLLEPVLKPGGSMYVCCDWRSGMVIGNLLEKRFKVLNRITWQREKGRGARLNWKNGMEDIWFVAKSSRYTFNPDAVKQRRRVIAPYRDGGIPKDWEQTEQGNFRNTCASNFWDDISIPYWSMAENTAHPTQKPEKLLAKLILASSNEGDIVFDPFLGSGSTSVTAKKLGRHYVGIEQNEQYCVWAEKRLELADDDKRIQGFEDGVFWERNSRPNKK